MEEAEVGDRVAAGRESEGGFGGDSGDGSDVLVVLPTYNEIETLEGVTARIHAQLPRAQLLIIDDASPDGTGELADRLARDSRIEVLHRPGKLGLGTAYIAGFEHARDRGVRWCVQMDSDGSHAPEQLGELLAAAEGGAGLVVGTRWMPGGRVIGWPRYRRWISRTGTRVARSALRSQLRDMTSGFRVIDRQCLERLELSRIASQGYGFQVEVAWTLERFGCRIAEVPITFTERAAGSSKMSVGIVCEALRLVLRWGWELRLFPGRLPKEKSQLSV